MNLGKNILDPQFSDYSGLRILMSVTEKTKSILIDNLLDLDCKVYVPKSEKDAIQKLRFHSFNIIIFEENHHWEAVQMLQNFSMSVRRYMFFVFIGENVETMNLIQSFVLSCNLLINVQELDHFHEILLDAMQENNLFFRSLHNAIDKSY